MKILHTSDWHLGHTLYNYDRSREQQAFLKQLTRIVAEEMPDAMVVSGDIYHYSTPSASTQKMYTDGMLEIHRACPEMTIVVTAGNHDSSSKLEIDSSLWNHFGVKVVGNIERNQEEVNLEKHIVEVRNDRGILKGYIIAIPHVYPQNFPILDTETPREERQARFFQALQDEVEKMNAERLPVVLMAHLSIEGSDQTGHDDTVGGIEYVPISAMGGGYDYLALGHIHCPQNIKGSRHCARYCGTPLPVSFDEAYPHSVSIVEIQREKAPQIKTIEIDVIVLRSAELHKLEYLKLFSHLIDIYQLGTFFRKFGTETPDKGFRRIHGSQTRNRSLHRFPSDLDGIFRRNSSS